MLSLGTPLRRSVFFWARLDGEVPFTQISDTIGKGGVDGLGDGGMGELETGGDEFGGVDAGAGEESFIGYFAEGEAEGEGGGGNDGGPVDGLGQGAGELGVGDGSGSSEVDRAVDGRGVKKKKNGGDRILEADPAHPLPAGTERAAEAEAEEGKHFGKRAGSRTDDDTKAERYDTDAGLGGRLGGGLPFLAHLGQEA